MSKEVKKDEPKTSGTKYLIVGLVVILAGVYALLSNNSTNEQTVTIAKPTATTEQAPVTEQITVAEETPATKESTVARIDITTPLVNADEPQFEVYVDGSEEPEKQAAWMPKFGKQGYVVQNSDGAKDIRIKALNDTNINIVLRGKREVVDGKCIPHRVTYTAFTINEKPIISETKSVWCKKTYSHTIKAKNGEEYKIYAEWQKHNK